MLLNWDTEKLNARLTQESHRPFDLGNGPVLRINLYKRSSEEYVLLLVVHHISSDFWSMLVFLDELLMLYPAEKAGVQIFLSPLKFSYPDFANWQARMLSSSEGDRLWNYWHQKLSGELPVLNLPTDYPRPPVQTYNGASHGFRLDEKLTGKIKKLVQTSDTTLYTILLAAFQVLLYRYTGQEDIMTGSPTSGRNRTEFEEISGYFVNPLVMRSDLSGNPGFGEFLGRVRQTVLDALDHQGYPFQLLVEQLNPERDASRSPLFQVMFAFQQPHRLKESAGFVVREAGARMEAGGLVLESLALENRVAQFDLTLMMVEADRGISASLEYNTDLFKMATNSANDRTFSDPGRGNCEQS